MTDENPCVLYLRDQVVGGPVTYHEIHPTLRRMDFEDISDGEEDPNAASDSDEEIASEEELEDVQEEEIQEEFQEDVLEEDQNMEMWDMELNEDAAIWELDDLQEDFEIWEPDEEEDQEEGPVEWEFDPEEAPAVESSDDEEFCVCHKGYSSPFPLLFLSSFNPLLSVSHGLSLTAALLTATLLTATITLVICIAVSPHGDPHSPRTTFHDHPHHLQPPFVAPNTISSLSFSHSDPLTLSHSTL
ncbi:hypothetical protein RIF29_15274 [Crotalaria pallida]|uniref:Uncharacterized protein n=1 Tax=Crotalaria pallida TaxID=3830 RepID=A0AAN9IDG1_CROPI